MSANQELKSLWGTYGELGSVSEDNLFYPGELGKTAFVNPTTGSAPVPIEVQKVKRYTTDTVTSADGGLAYWQDLDNVVVTADVATALGGSANPLVAGVFRGAHPTAGKYGLIQIGGIAKLTVSSSTVAVGDPVVSDANNGVAGAVVAQATAPATTAVIKTLVGKALATGSTTVQVKVILTLPRFGR